MAWVPRPNVGAPAGGMPTQPGSPFAGRFPGHEMPPVVEGRGFPSMKKGGKVKKTGLYKLHKGEKVLKAKKGRKKSDTRAYVAGERA